MKISFLFSHKLLILTILCSTTALFLFSFGVALSRLTKQTPTGVKWDRILLVQLMEELLEVFMMIVIWIVKITPIAVISLISTAIGSEEDINAVISSIGILLGAVMTGVILQFFLVYCGLYIFFMRENPLTYYKGMIPVFTMAFASASSAATLPVTISCAVASGKVPESVARFVLPLGGTGMFLMMDINIQLLSNCHYHTNFEML